MLLVFQIRFQMQHWWPYEKIMQN